MESGEQAAAQIFDAAKADPTGVQSTGVELLLRAGAAVLHVARGEVDNAEQRDGGRLGMCGACDGSQHGESKRGFFHCDS